MENVTTCLMNPWVSMWTRPRATIQQIVDTNPKHLVLLVAALSGFAQALDRASMRNAGDHLPLPVLVVIAAIAGPIGGLIGLYIGGALIRWTGSWIGGKGTSQNIRAALAWSSVPAIWALLLWIPQLALLRGEIFASQTPRMNADPLLALMLLTFAVIEMTIGIWTIVISLKALGQVQGFSAWKALGNLLLCLLVLAIPIGCLVMFAVALGCSA